MTSFRRYGRGLTAVPGLQGEKVIFTFAVTEAGGIRPRGDGAVLEPVDTEPVRAPGWDYAVGAALVVVGFVVGLMAMGPS